MHRTAPAGLALCTEGPNGGTEGCGGGDRREAGRLIPDRDRRLPSDRGRRAEAEPTSDHGAPLGVVDDRFGPVPWSAAHI